MTCVGEVDGCAGVHGENANQLREISRQKIGLGFDATRGELNGYRIDG